MKLHGFPAEERIHARREFLRAYQVGLRLRRNSFTLHVVANGLAYPRLGLAVGRRVGPAHVRNLVKRRVRDVFRRNKGRSLAGWDLVLTAQPAMAAQSWLAILKWPGP